MSDPAPLISIPDAPAPEGAVAEWFEGKGGLRLRAAVFPPQGAPRGSVVVSPGRTEPIEKYFEVARELNARGFLALVHDWRGQGLSARLLPDRLKGYVGDVQDYMVDYGLLLDWFEARLPKPWIALGHSMGGALTLLALAQGERRFSAAVLSSPMLRIKTGFAPLWLAEFVAWLMILFGNGAAYAHGTYDPLADRFVEEAMTHDRVRYARYKAQLNACPDLALGATTWGWAHAAFKAGDLIAAKGALEGLDFPVAIAGAGADRLVSNDAEAASAARLPHGLYLKIPGAFHEVLMETDERRNEYWRLFDALAETVSPPPV